MGIQCRVQTRPISYHEYHAIDYKVMGLAYSIHNDLGRFWNEGIYRNELAHRCRKSGFENVAMEVPIDVSYKDFNKTYFIDLLINNVIYELKAVQALTGNHQRQPINYLLLMGLNHGKLINMRPLSVEHRFVSTKLTPKKRYHFTIDDEQWPGVDEDSRWLKQIIKSLLEEWGTFLDTDLFYDAIIYFRGGKENVIKDIDIKDGSQVLGKQKAHLLNSNIAFKITSVTKDKNHYQKHLHKFLRHTPLKAIQWINFNKNRVEFKTIFK